MDSLGGNDRQCMVSVVLPAYNHVKYIVEAMQSVRDQTFTQWELIVIDDGSTDGTWELIQSTVQEWSDPRIRVIGQKNAGSHATINRGLSMAVAPYLAILNSDDRYDSGRLARLMDVAQSHPGECFVVTGVRLIDGFGQPLPTDHWWNAMYAGLLANWNVAEQHSKHPAVDALLWGNFAVSTSNFFMSRETWQRLGGVKRLRYVPDWEFALRVAVECPYAFHFLAEEKLLDYRLHGKNTILGGALRNHAEAYQMLRMVQRKWANRGGKIPLHAIDRLHYLDRFIRHEHARQLLEHQQKGWQEQVEAEREHAVKLREQVEAEREHAVRLQEQLNAVHGSTSWRLTRPLRQFKTGWSKLKKLGAKIRRRLERHQQQQFVASTYQQWLEGEALHLANRPVHPAPESPISPRITVSVLMPVHNTPAHFLQEAVASVQAQDHVWWELCICDDASTLAETVATLSRLASADPRIKLTRRAQSGHIVQATNDALAMASGAYVVFLDHDDLLAPHALSRLVQEVQARPVLDFIYSDEDKINEQGERCLPLFKPDWSPALQWSQNYVGHIMCVRRSLLEEIGGLQEGTEGSQDHDLVLRLASAGACIAHIPEVLYHWRMHSGSTASHAGAKPYAHEAGKTAVAQHLTKRYGTQFKEVDDADNTFVYWPRFQVPATCLVSIIIPTRDKADLLQNCIDSIRQHTQGTQYEIIVLNNGSTEPATQVCFAGLLTDERIRVVTAHMPFNWSRLNNLGRQHASGQVLVFLNNDTLVISPDWLQRLAEYALLPDVATVGPLLLYPDNTIQHAGVVVGMGGWADHVFKAEAVHHYPSPYISSVVPRNVMANTGACVAIATEKLDAMGGFDEAFEICGSDVELGIRAHKRGWQNVYLPTVRLYHLESKTRSAFVPEVDFQQSALKYAPYRVEGDPFYNRNLDILSPQPRPKFPS